MSSEFGGLVSGLDNDFALDSTSISSAVCQRLRDIAGPALFLSAARRLLILLADNPDSKYLYSDPKSRYGVDLFCWLPGIGNQPHLHRSWNVSAVLAGCIHICRSAVSEADCLVAEPLVATAGQVGVLLPPQFHCLRNSSITPAITLHVFSSEGKGTGLGPKFRPPLAARLDDEQLLAIVAISVSFAGARARDIVLGAFDLVQNDAKLTLMKVMVTLDLATAAVLARRLAPLVGIVDQPRLIKIARELESHVGD